jgi:hypothetical protein
LLNLPLEILPDSGDVFGDFFLEHGLGLLGRNPRSPKPIVQSKRPAKTTG